MMLSKRINNIDESGTLKFTLIIERLRKEKKEIINFSVGEPYLPLSDPILSATKDAIDNGKTRYSDVMGVYELREMISNQFIQKNINYGVDNIIITNGAKQGLFNAMQAICNPNDEVIIPKPFWPTFSEQVKLSYGKPILIDTVNNQLDTEKIKEAITKKTKAIIVNNPNNPTGALYPRGDLEFIGDLVVDNKIFVISDEAYDFFVYDNQEFTSMSSLKEEVRAKVITVKSFSKQFSMTGFRVGYVAAENAVIECMKKLQGHTTGNVCTFAQYGAIAALRNWNVNKKIVAEFEKRRNLAYRLTREMFECIKPSGAFYLFPNVINSLDKDKITSEDLALHILEKAKVALIPGEVFGVDNHVRISYAVSEEEIKKGFENMADVL